MSSDSTEATLISLGSCQDTDIVIPKVINGFKVTKITTGAFYRTVRSAIIDSPKPSLRKKATSGTLSITFLPFGNKSYIFFNIFYEPLFAARCFAVIPFYPLTQVRF